MQTTARNADLADLADLLREQHARRLDVVAPATTLRSENGVLVVKGAEAEITADGVTQTDGRYRPTTVCDEGIAEKLGVPLPYLRRLRNERPDLYDANVNGLLRGSKTRVAADGTRTQEHPADPRKFLVRCFRGDDGSEGIARAFLSDSYKIVDNLDVLTAALDGIRQAGADVEVTGADLSDRRMYVRIAAPSVTALAPTLLDGYRSPFRDGGVSRVARGEADAWQRIADKHGLGTVNGQPIVFAGFVLSNSETGGGAFTITPRVTVLTCLNGMTVTKDAMRSVHLGGRLDEGVVRWSADTQRKALDLVTAKARDAVATFLDVDYVRGVVADMERQASARITDAPAVVKTVGKVLSYDEATTKGILDHFILGGQPTAGGLLNAVTSYAQTVADADVAADLEASALRAMEIAAQA